MEKFWDQKTIFFISVYPTPGVQKKKLDTPGKMRNDVFNSSNRAGIDFTAKVRTFDPARSAWEPYRIAEQLGMDKWNTFEKIDIEINLVLEVLSSIFDKNMLFPLIL